MPAPIVYALGTLGGAAVSLGLEYVTSGGKATRRDYFVAGAVGAVPGGYGFIQVPRTLQKGYQMARVGRWSRQAQRGKKVTYLGSKPDLYTTRKEYYRDALLFFTPEYAMVGAGFATAGYAGWYYDSFMTGSAGQVINQSQLGSGRTITSQPSRKTGPCWQNRSPSKAVYSYRLAGKAMFASRWS